MIMRALAPAQEALADVIWWFKGFAANVPADQPGVANDVYSMMENARETRILMGRLLEGQQRYLGDGSTGTLIVLNLPELERITDFLSDCAPHLCSDEWRELALQRFNELRAIAARAADEELAANPDAPF